MYQPCGCNERMLALATYHCSIVGSQSRRYVLSQEFDHSNLSVHHRIVAAKANCHAEKRIHCIGQTRAGWFPAARKVWTSCEPRERIRHWPRKCWLHFKNL